MGNRSADAHLCALFLFEVVGSNPEGVVLPLEVELPLMCQFLSVGCVYCVLFDVDVGVVGVLPESDEVWGAAAYLCPLFVVEVLAKVLFVAHSKFTLTLFM